MAPALSGRIRAVSGLHRAGGRLRRCDLQDARVRDGDGWVINGSKMFTSNAQNAAYVYLITNTDPSRPNTRA